MSLINSVDSEGLQLPTGCLTTAFIWTGIVEWNIGLYHMAMPFELAGPVANVIK
jgi:hypothetical protein